LRHALAARLDIYEIDAITEGATLANVPVRNARASSFRVPSS
jgi:hypothetical protein